MPEIFGRVPLDFGGGFAADAANIFFGTFSPDIAGNLTAPASTGTGLLVQNIGIQYQQPINRIFEIGGAYAYYVAGRPQGNMTLGRIVGPRPISVAFYIVFGDVCLGPVTTMFFGAAQGCTARPVLGVGTPNQFMFAINGSLLQSIGLSVAAQDMIVNEQLQFMFISLLVPNFDGTFS